MAATSPGKTARRQRRHQNAGHSDAQSWGKEIAKTVYSSDHLKNDPLLKTLQGKITVEFDYKPWQRTSGVGVNTSQSSHKKSVPSKTRYKQPNRRKLSSAVKPSSRPVSGRTVSSIKSFVPLQSGMVTGGIRPFSAETAKSACSSTCVHPWNKKPPVVDDAEEQRKQNAISIMKVNNFV